MLMIFLIYWILPNKKIPIKRLIPAAVVVGILLEALKYVNVLTWPWLRAKLMKETPPFVQSISIILWSFCAAMLILAGAEWSARVRLESAPESGSAPATYRRSGSRTNVRTLLPKYADSPNFREAYRAATVTEYAMAWRATKLDEDE